MPQTTNLADFLDKTCLETTDLGNAEIFKSMQGNILKGHGRDHASMIFIRFKEKEMVGIEHVKEMLGDFVEEHVTSFYKQLWERERYKRNKVPGDTFGAIFFTKAGCDYLGMKEIDENKLNDPAFIDGMKNRKDLNDLKDFYEDWNNKEIHVMLLLADDDKNRMDTKAGLILKVMDKKKIAEFIHIEYGDAIRNANGDGLEHNGYVDGISQPLFLQDEVEDYIKRHNIKNDKFEFDPRKKPGLVLFEDPYVKSSVSCASYFVFRKLEQDVKHFKKEEEEIGEDIYGKDTEESERAGAMLVGRFEDGTPIQVQQEDKLIGSGAFNNFNYGDDPSKGKCPHFAHIRKTNPRTEKKDGVHIFDDSTMARRGIPYGHRNVSTELDEIQTEQFPEGGVGLLFMSYQRSIVDQFEKIQKRANDPNSSGDASSRYPNDGVDPVIGQTINDSDRPDYIFPEDADTIPKPPATEPAAKLIHPFKRRITFKGGEYFFAPSITFLKTLPKSPKAIDLKQVIQTVAESQIHKSL